MDIKRAKEEIKNTIEAYLVKDRYGNYEIPQVRQRPVLLIGPPGIGKTQIMEQISIECGIGLVAYTITHHTRQSAVGLPFIEKKVYGGREYSITEYTMSEIVASIYNKIESTGLKEGILFIDEINCVSETLAPTMLQFLQMKTFGTHRIPEGWIIVAAGNPPEYNKSVREFDIVTLDRIKMIHVEADYEVWKEYALSADIHPAIMAYLDIKRQNFCETETTVDGKQFATPRGWEDLSQLLKVYEGLGRVADRDVVSEYIQHPRIAKDFANYLELYYKYRQDYNVEDIAAGRTSPALYAKLERAEFDEKLGIISLLLARLNNGFRSIYRSEQLLERLQTLLSGIDPDGNAAVGTEAEGGTAENDGAFVCSAGQIKTADIPALLADLCESEEREREYRLSAGLITRQEDYLRRDCIAALKKLRQAAEIAGGNAPENHSEKASGSFEYKDSICWQAVRAGFNEMSDAYESEFDTAAETLEHVFDFCEAAFGIGQEMVIFVTGLNNGMYSLHFLQEYDCERYYRYNKELLFEDEEHRVLDSINRRNS